MAVETRVQVTMPQMGESVTEGVVLEWHVKEGDREGADDVLVEISTDKVDAEVPSPAAGTVVAIVAPEGETVGEVQVYGGEKSGVALKAKGPVAVFVPITNRDRLVARIVYEGPVIAPVEEGVEVGSLKVWIGDTLSQETPLYTAEAVRLGALHQRALDAVGELLVGWMR